MRAMVLERPGTPLAERDVEPPEPGAGQLLLRVHACGVCRTDLHVHAGELPAPEAAAGAGTRDRRHRRARRRGRRPVRAGHPGRRAVARLDLRRVPLLPLAAARTSASAPRFTGYDLDGGYAEYAVADERYCFPIPEATPPSTPRRSSAPASSATAPSSPPATRDGSACTASAPRPTSWPRSRGTRGGGCSPSRARAMSQASASPASSAPSGPAARMSGRPSRWTRPSCSRPWARSCLWRSGPTRQGRHGRLRGDPHVADPVASRTSCSGASGCVRSVANLTRRTAKRSSGSPRRCRSRSAPRHFRSAQANEALERVRSGRCAARPFSSM